MFETVPRKEVIQTFMNIHPIILTDYTATTDPTTNCVFGLYLGTAGSYGVEQLEVIPSTGWEDLAVTAIFQPCGVKVSVPAEGGVIDVPWEATACELSYPKGRIVFQGYAEGKLVNSCDIIYTVSGHSATDGAEGQLPPTPQPGGSDGGYYFPIVQDGVLSWQPSKADMPPAESANVQGPKGSQGEPGIPGADGKDGEQGPQGENGGYYTPSVDDEGNLSWQASLPDMPPVESSDIKGPPGNGGTGSGAELPATTETDARKALTVNAAGTGYELSGPYLPAEAGICPVAFGNPATINHTISWPIQSIKIVGLCTQDHPPENGEVVPIQKFDGGTITVQVTDGAGQTVTAQLECPVGLYGVSDSNGSIGITLIQQLDTFYRVIRLFLRQK